MSLPSENELRANPRPWLTDRAISYLESVIQPTDKVLEFGGGWSSLWWAERVAWVETVEADYKWACKILTEMAAKPRLLTRWTLRFVASEWTIDFTKPKQYWAANQALLSQQIARSLEDCYLAINFDPDIIVIDGSARVRNIQEVDRYLHSRPSRIRLIVVDNMEWASRFTEGVFADFSRLDFPETDVAKIPAHQNGKWMTSIWIRW